MTEEMSVLMKKIEAVETPRVKKCAVAYSGGLDSTLGIEMLKRVYKVETVVPITVDVGQGKEEIEMGQRRAKLLGIEPIVATGVGMAQVGGPSTGLLTTNSAAPSRAACWQKRWPSKRSPAMATKAFYLLLSLLF